MWRHLHDTVAAVGTLPGYHVPRMGSGFSPLGHKAALQASKREAGPRACPSFLLYTPGPKVFLGVCFHLLIALPLPPRLCFPLVPESVGGGASIGYWYKGGGTPF